MSGRQRVLGAIGVIGPGAAPLHTLNRLVAALPKTGRLGFSFNDHALSDPAYAAAVPDPKPARSTVGVSGLAFGAALEIECIAALPE